MTAIPSRCTAGTGPSPFPQRLAPCKICLFDIEPTEASLTHNQSPCFNVFHTDCLLEWLPHAAHVAPEYDTGNKHPSCPNCRGSLGETDLPSEDEDDDDYDRRVPFVLPSFAYPVQSLDELRNIVGDDEFNRRPLSERRFPRVISVHEIPIEQTQPPPLTTANTQATDAQADFADLFQTYGNAIPNPTIDLHVLHPESNLRNAPDDRPTEVGTHFSADAVRDFFHAALRARGILYYEAFYFAIPSTLNTCFYLPISPTINPLPSLDALRRVVRERRVFHDPDLQGRWLREPVVYPTAWIRDVMDTQQHADGLRIMDDVFNNVFRSEAEMQGWSLYLPSDIERRFTVYAVPRVTLDVSTHDGEAGKVVEGFWRENGEVDNRRYWSRWQPENDEEYSEMLRVFGSHEAVRGHQDMEIVQFDRAFERSMLDAAGAVADQEFEASNGRRYNATAWLDENIEIRTPVSRENADDSGYETEISAESVVGDRGQSLR